MPRCANPDCGFDLSKEPGAKHCPKCGREVGSFVCANCKQLCAPGDQDALSPDQCAKCAAARRGEQTRRETAQHERELAKLRQEQKQRLTEIDGMRSALDRAQQAASASAQSAEAQRHKLDDALALAARIEGKVAEVEGAKLQQQHLLSQLGLLEARLTQEQHRHAALANVGQDLETVRRAQRECSSDLSRLDEAMRGHLAALDKQHHELSKRLGDMGLQVSRVEQIQKLQEVRLNRLDGLKADYTDRLRQLEQIAQEQAAKAAELEELKRLKVEDADRADALSRQRQAELGDLGLRQTQLQQELAAFKGEQSDAVARLKTLRQELDADAQLRRQAREQVEALVKQQDRKLSEMDSVTAQLSTRMDAVERQQAEMRRLSNEAAAHLDAIKEASQAAAKAQGEFEQLKDEWLKTFGIIHAAVQSGAGLHIPAGGGITVERPRSDIIDSDILRRLASIHNPKSAFVGRVWSDRESAVAAARTRDINLVPTDSKAVYRPGEMISLCFQCERDCCLTVIDVGTSGAIKVLFPNLWHQDNFLRAGETHMIPQSDYPFKFEIDGPAGIESVKAIFTLDPLDLTSGGFSQQQPFKDISAVGNTRDIKKVVDNMASRITELPRDRWAESTCEFFVDA